MSGRLPGPVTGRPRRPLSNSASTASCSIRFSLLTMISGAPRSISRFNRLFRLITRRYRSLRSEVAKRPPSSCTIGRSSGGITGTQSSTMPSGEFVRLLERRDDLEPLDRADLALALAVLDGVAQDLGLGVDVEVRDDLLERLGAHAAVEVVAEAVLQLAVEHLVDDQVADLELAEGVEHLVEPVDLRAARGRGSAAARARRPRAPCGARRTWRPRPRARPGRPSSFLARASMSASRAFSRFLRSTDISASMVGRSLCRCVVVDRGDQVGREVDDLLEILRGQVEQVAQARRDALEVPDVGDRRGQLDVAHPLTTHLGASDLDAATLADDALEPDPLVLAAGALPVPGRAEDLLAEEPVLLRLEGAVVDGFRLLDLAVGPRANVVRGGETDTQLVEEVDVEHWWHVPVCQ